MGIVKVWAPYARQVRLRIRNSLTDMNKKEKGWWTLDTPLAEQGADYSFVLDDKRSLPDPGSGWQPEGVHGPSRILNHNRYIWNDSNWQQPPLSSAVVYELHVGTFSSEGTFEGILKHLEHLKDLGVTHIEIMPVAGFSGTRGWGYDGVDLYAPHHAYGGPEGLKTLVDACHNHGFAVILDVVYNHLGPEGNYLENFGPYFTDRYATPWGRAINLDGPDSHEVRRFFIDNALMWLRDYHMDGLRIDAVHAILDTSAIHFMEQLAEEVKLLEASLGRHFILIAENDLNDSRIVKPPEAGGYGLNAQWNEDFHHALHTLLTKENRGYYQDFGGLSHLARVVTRGLVYDGIYSRYRRKIHGRPADGLSGHSFIGCLQNHDQTGNRASGKRIGHLVTPGRLKIGAALVMTSPFVPMLFQGEEWGASSPFQYFTDHQDTDLGRAVREGRQREFAAFGWRPEDIPDPQAVETFNRSKLLWDELNTDYHQDIYNWYKRLIRLRRSVPDLSDGRLDRVKTEYDERSEWIIIKRGPVQVVCNLSEGPRTIPVEKCSECKILLASEEDISVKKDTVIMPRETAAVFGY